MTQPFYEAQTDVAVGSRGKASDINNLDSAVEQAFKNVHAYGVDSGTSSAYAITMDTDATAYYDGMVVMFAPDNTCAAAATVNVNGLGAKSIYNANHSSGIVQAGDIKTSTVATMVYNATQGGFYLQGGPTGPSHGTASAAATNTAYGDNAANSLTTGVRNTAIGYDAGTALTDAQDCTAVGYQALAAGASMFYNTAIGAYTMGSATASYCVAVGRATMQNVTGSQNTGVGLFVMNDLLGGTNNTGLGYQAGNSAVLGAYNVFIGATAGTGIIDGTNNTFVGAGTATTGDYSNSTAIGYGVTLTASNQVIIGDSSVTETVLRGIVKSNGGFNYRGGDNASATNSAFGEGALDTNGGGAGNTAVGNDSMTANTLGNSNTASGYRSLYTCTIGYNNCAFGYQAMNSMLDGNDNIAVGLQALYTASSAARNVAVGNGALKFATGDDNIGIGDLAGDTITTGFQNICIGRNSDTIAAAQNSIAIGQSAAATASNQVVLGNSSITEVTTAGKLQILSGTAVPAGGTAGAGLRFSTTANLGVFFGSGAPTLAAAKGSLYLRTDGTTTNNRMYVNTDGGTTWTAVTTAA